MLIPSVYVVQHLSRPAAPGWGVGGLILGGMALLWLLYQRAYGGTAGAESAPSDETDGGSVYVLSNPGHDDLVKIGWTTRSAATRAGELSSATGVPDDFAVEYETETANPQAVEQTVHDRLADRKVNRSREFFEVTPETARRTIERVNGPEASAVRRGLGLVLLALSVLGVLVLGTYHPADDALVRSTSFLKALFGGMESGSARNALGDLGARLAHAFIPKGLGYLALVPVGLIGLVGSVLVRARRLRPLLFPATLVLLASLAGAGLIGWFVPPAQTGTLSWSGGAGTPSGLILWAGALGQALAHAAQALLGSLGALALWGTMAGGALLLLGWWTGTTAGR